MLSDSCSTNWSLAHLLKGLSLWFESFLKGRGGGLQMVSRAEIVNLGGRSLNPGEKGLGKDTGEEIEVGAGHWGCPRVPSPASFPV